MIRLFEKGAYLVNGTEIIPEEESSNEKFDTKYIGESGLRQIPF